MWIYVRACRMACHHLLPGRVAERLRLEGDWGLGLRARPPLEGPIEPGRVFDFDTDLDHVAEAYAAMDERRAIKSLLRVGTI